MSESLAELQALLDKEKSALADNLVDLEQKVRETTDWRVQVGRHPLATVGMAAAGGLALGMLVGGKRSPASNEHAQPSATPTEPSPAVAHLQDAAVSIAAGLMVGLLRDFLSKDAAPKT